MAEVTIRSGDDLVKLQRELKGMDKALQKRMRAAITKGTKKMKADIRRNADRLPKSGGLSARVAGSRMSTRNRLSGKNIGVSIAAKSREGYDMEALDDGRVRHKTFGREPWQEQAVPGGFFADGVRSGADDAREAILAEANDIAREIERAH